MGARVLLRDLSPGTLYFLQIRGKNGPYSSPWSNIFELMTIHDVVPPMPVTDLVWESVGTSFRATWTPPEFSEDGTPAYDLKDYVVTIWAPADGAVPGIPAPDPSKRFEFVVGGPRFDLTFEQNVASFEWPRGKVAIEVRARDTTGNKSQPTFATAQNPVPAEVPSFDATGLMDAIAFDWTRNPSPPDDDIKFYRIRQGLAANAIDLIIAESNDIHTEWATINTALQHFSIVAVDVFHQESATKKTDTAQARSSLEVDVTPPDAPTNVTTSSGIDDSDPSRSSAYIDVSWTRPPIADNTDLQEYVIRYSTTQGDWRYLVVPAEEADGTPVQTARIAGLQAGQSYYVALKVVDYTANTSAWVNSATYPQGTPKDTSAPSTPEAPTVAVDKGATLMQVTHSLKKADGVTNLETDLHHFEVYASTTSGFTPSSANRVGDLLVVPPPVSAAPIPAVENFTLMPTGGTSTQTWYVKVIAVDNAGNRSAASAQSSGAVELIKTVNIADAAITDAKIGNLSANKITAGTGFINDITVKSTFTMGDEFTNGIIKSYDYTPGVKGWQIDKNGVSIVDGTISARALSLQDGENLLQPAYTDFEFAPSWYTTKIFAVNSATWGISATQKRYNAQSLLVTTGAGGSGGVYLSPAANTYNIPVDPAEKYIISAYAYSETGATVSLTAVDSTGNAVEVSGNVVIPAATWTRISGMFTPAASAVAMNLYLGIVGASNSVYWDGIQVERQLAGSTSPSVWQPYSRTYIDGGNITTGSIQSNQPSDGVSGQPAWSINTNGGMQVGNANVRGTLYVGPTGGNESASSARSGVYSPYVGPDTGTGWIIRGDGYAEFMNAVIRGNIQATSGRFINTVIVGASGTDSSSYVGSANANGTSTGWHIRGDGYAAFTNVFVNGHVQANSGYFAGTIKAGASVEANLSITSPLITGGTIRGATLIALNGTGHSIVLTNTAGYGRLEFNTGHEGLTIPADIRIGETTGIAVFGIQMYSPAYGGNRSHISCIAQTGSNAAEVDLVAPGGNIFISGYKLTFGMAALSPNWHIDYLPPIASTGRHMVWNSQGDVYYDTSSREVKRDIIPTRENPYNVLKLQMKDWRPLQGMPDENVVFSGLIAEDVVELFPTANVVDENGKTVNYADRTVLSALLEVVKDQENRLSQLEARA